MSKAIPPSTAGHRWEVAFFEAFEEERAAIASHLSGTIRAGYLAATIQEADLMEPPAPIISIRTQSRIPDSWVPGIRALLSRSTGYDHLAAHRDRFWSTPPATASAPLAYGYLPRYCARAVAEQAMLLWSALGRRLNRQMRQFPAFQRDGITGQEMQGKTLLVVGVGHIGGEIARIGLGLGMNVVGVDPVRKHDFLPYVPLDEGIAQAHIIACAMNLTPLNHGLFSYPLLARCRPGAIFINIARGEMAPCAPLLRLLEEGRLGGVGLDVFEDESHLAVALRSGNGHGTRDPGTRTLMDLLGRDDVICTPHNAFNTVESVERKAEQSARQVAHYLETGRFLWEVPRSPPHQKEG